MRISYLAGNFAPGNTYWFVQHVIDGVYHSAFDLPWDDPEKLSFVELTCTEAVISKDEAGESFTGYIFRDEHDNQWVVNTPLYVNIERYDARKVGADDSLEPTHRYIGQCMADLMYAWQHSSRSKSSAQRTMVDEARTRIAAAVATICTTTHQVVTWEPIVNDRLKYVSQRLFTLKPVCE